MKRHLLRVCVHLLAAALLAACGEGKPSAHAPATLRLGYFANVTQAP